MAFRVFSIPPSSMSYTDNFRLLNNMTSHLLGGGYLGANHDGLQGVPDPALLHLLHRKLQAL